jgi:hypothetical protein
MGDREGKEIRSGELPTIRRLDLAFGGPRRLMDNSPSLEKDKTTGLPPWTQSAGSVKKGSRSKKLFPHRGQERRPVWN